MGYHSLPIFSDRSATDQDTSPYVSVVVRHRDEVLAGADAELVHAANHRINIIRTVSTGTLTAGHK